MSDHLWRRGDQWYLKLTIPRTLRQRFPSKTGKAREKIVEPLGTGDKPLAKVISAQRVATYLQIFAEMKAGKVMTPEEIRARVSFDLGGITEQIRRDILESAPKMHPNELARKAGDALAGQLVFTDLPIMREAAKRGVAVADALARTRKAAYEEVLARASGTPAPPMMTAPVPAPVVATETIGQAAEAWFAQMQNDPSAAVRETTLDGHRNFVRAFIEYCGGDIPLTSVTRAMASDFLAKKSVRRSNRTVNKYATTWAGIFRNARYRGRFTGDNPFEGLKRKAIGKKIDPFTMPELQTIFAPFKFEISPAKHSPATALPWISLIALYNGLCLEEIAQMDVADMHEQDGILVFDVHNGARHQLKNERARPRLVPVHSALLSFGLLRYRDSLPRDGLLFPGLVRRASKGDKIGVRIGEMFGKHIARLEISQKAKEEKRKVSFHSFRKNAGGAMERGGASESDAGRVLGHALGMTFGTYSRPVLERVQETVERIQFPGLLLPTAIWAGQK